MMKKNTSSSATNPLAGPTTAVNVSSTDNLAGSGSIKNASNNNSNSTSQKAASLGLNSDAMSGSLNPGGGSHSASQLTPASYLGGSGSAAWGAKNKASLDLEVVSLTTSPSASRQRSAASGTPQAHSGSLTPGGVSGAASPAAGGAGTVKGRLNQTIQGGHGAGGGPTPRAERFNPAAGFLNVGHGFGSSNLKRANSITSAASSVDSDVFDRQDSQFREDDEEEEEEDSDEMEYYADGDAIGPRGRSPSVSLHEHLHGAASPTQNNLGSPVTFTSGGRRLSANNATGGVPGSPDLKNLGSSSPHGSPKALPLWGAPSSPKGGGRHRKGSFQLDGSGTRAGSPGGGGRRKKAGKKKEHHGCCYNFFHKPMKRGRHQALDSSSLGFLSRTNPLRMATYNIVHSRPFELFIILFVFLNCVALALDDPREDPDNRPFYKYVFDMIFLAVFTLEMVLKVVALGFVGHHGAYLRSGWNRLDFFIVILSFLDLFGSAIGKYTAVRTLRVLRPLRSMNAVPQLKAIVVAMMTSIRSLVNVLTLCGFIFAIFGIMAVQLWSGNFQMRCRSISDPEYVLEDRFCRNDTLHYPDELIGKVCDPGFECINLGNPNYGFTSFDNVLYAFLVIVQVITLEGWALIMYSTMDHSGAYAAVYFVLLVLIGSYFLLNLALAVISFEFGVAKAEQQEKEKAQQEVDMRSQSLFLSRQSMSEVSKMPWSMSRWKRGVANYLDLKEVSEEKRKGWGLPDKFKFLVAKIRFHCFWLTEGDPTDATTDTMARMSTPFSWTISIIVLLNTVVLAAEHHGQSDTQKQIAEISNILFTAVFAVEMVLRMVSLSIRGYLSSLANIFDAFITIASLVELAFLDASGGVSVLRAFRLLRVFRLTRRFPGLRQVVEVCIVAVGETLFLNVIIMLYLLIAALTGMQLFGGSFPPESETGLRSNFDSFLYSFYAVFQVLTRDSWPDMMWLSMKQTSQAASVFYILCVFAGDFIILNLFLAVLMSSWHKNRHEDEDDDEEDELELEADELYYSAGGYGQSKRSFHKGSAIFLNTSAFNNNNSSNNDRSALSLKSVNDDDIVDQKNTGAVIWREPTVEVFGNSNSRPPTATGATTPEAGEGEGGEGKDSATHGGEQKRNSSATKNASEEGKKRKKETWEEQRKSLASIVAAEEAALKGEQNLLLEDVSPSKNSEMSISEKEESSRHSISFIPGMAGVPPPEPKKMESAGGGGGGRRRSTITFLNSEALAHVPEANAACPKCRVRIAECLPSPFPDVINQDDRVHARHCKKLKVIHLKMMACKELLKEYGGERAKLSRRISGKEEDLAVGIDGETFAFVRNDAFGGGGGPHSGPNSVASGTQNGESVMDYDDDDEESQESDSLRNGENNNSSSDAKKKPAGVKGLFTAGEDDDEEDPLEIHSPKATKKNDANNDNNQRKSSFEEAADDSDEDDVGSGRAKLDSSKTYTGVELPKVSLPPAKASAINGGSTNNWSLPPPSRESVNEAFEKANSYGVLRGFLTEERRQQFYEEKDWAFFHKLLNEQREIYSWETRSSRQLGGSLIGYTQAPKPPKYYTNGGTALFLFGPNNAFRILLTDLVKHRYFDRVILFFILVSSVILAIDNPRKHEKDQSLSSNWTKPASYAFTGIFVVEALVKCIAYGFYWTNKKAYLREGWNLLDFIIITISAASDILDGINVDLPLSSLKVIRTFRALRPLLLINHNRGIKVIVSSIVKSVPGIVNVAVVGIIVYLVFAIVGVQFYKGAMYQCNDDTIHFKDNCTGFFVSAEDQRAFERAVRVANNSQQLGYAPSQPNVTQREWYNSDFHFDNTVTSFVALFHTATLDNWGETMYRVIDVTDENHGPSRDSAPYRGLFFIIFIIFGTFFFLNMFIGVIVFNFSLAKDKLDGVSSFVTEEQRRWIDAERMILNLKPTHKQRRGGHFLAGKCFDIAMHPIFEAAVGGAIFCNIIFIAAEHHNQPASVTLMSTITNYIFALVFLVEAVIKITAFGRDYFKSGGNQFDFFIVFISWVDIIFQDTVTIPINVGIFRIFRVFRIIRIMSLVKRAKNLRILLETLWFSLPSLANIGAFLALIFFIYSVVGVQVFSQVKRTDGLDHHRNFESFGNAFLFLIQVTTLDNWGETMIALMNDKDCGEGDNAQCGTDFAPVFFCTFILMASFVSVNMFVSIILENFETTVTLNRSNVKMTDLNRFVEVWTEFDPEASLLMPTRMFPRLLAHLQPPLGVTRSTGRLEVLYRCEAYDIPEHAGQIHFIETLVPLARCMQNVSFTPAELREHERRWRNEHPVLSELPVLRYREKRCAVDHYLGATFIQAAYKRRFATKVVERMRAEKRREIQNFIFANSGLHKTTGGGIGGGKRQENNYFAATPPAKSSSASVAVTSSNSSPASPPESRFAAERKNTLPFANGRANNNTNNSDDLLEDEDNIEMVETLRSEETVNTSFGIAREQSDVISAPLTKNSMMDMSNKQNGSASGSSQKESASPSNVADAQRSSQIAVGPSSSPPPPLTSVSATTTTTGSAPSGKRDPSVPKNSNAFAVTDINEVSEIQSI